MIGDWSAHHRPRTTSYQLPTPNSQPRATNHQPHTRVTLHLEFALLTVGIAVALFVVLLLLLDVGWRLGLRQVRKRGAEAQAGVGIVDGSVYALLALLVGFAFSGAATRFDHRRELIANEADAAGTAWQRADLLPAEQQVIIHDGFRRYLDALIQWYSADDAATSLVHQPAAVTLAQDNLWSRSVAACLTTGGEPARMLLLPALNELFGAVEKERMARRMHPPSVIFAMLAITALAAALFAGYGLASSTTRNWIYMIGIAATVSIAVYVILELEYPRLGFFRVTGMDQTLVELRATME